MPNTPNPKTPPPEQGPKPPTPARHLSDPVRYGILAVLVGAFIFNLLTHGDAALSLLLATGLIGAIGLDQNSRRGG